MNSINKWIYLFIVVTTDYKTFELVYSNHIHRHYDVVIVNCFHENEIIAVCNSRENLPERHLVKLDVFGEIDCIFLPFEERVHKCPKGKQNNFLFKPKLVNEFSDFPKSLASLYKRKCQGRSGRALVRLTKCQATTRKLEMPAKVRFH